MWLIKTFSQFVHMLRDVSCCLVTEKAYGLEKLVIILQVCALRDMAHTEDTNASYTLRVAAVDC